MGQVFCVHTQKGQLMTESNLILIPFGNRFLALSDPDIQCGLLRAEQLGYKHA